MAHYGVEKRGKCPALSFDSYQIAECELAYYNLIPIGDGCCMKARVYKQNIEYQFAGLVEPWKRGIVQSVLKMRGNVHVINVQDS